MNNTDIQIKETEANIQNMIYVIRGQQVMLDSDLATLYGYEVKNLNRQVKNNIKRFPKDFMFQLTNEEINDLWCKNCTAKRNTKSRSNPYAFSEQGIYMLSTVLKGELAINQSIMIMREFKRMRHYIHENQKLLNNSDVLSISNRLASHEERVSNIEKIISTKMATKEDIEKIMDNFINEDNIKDITILDGQKFEANEAYTKIYKSAKQFIYIIDDYIDIDTLSLLKSKKKNVDAIIFSDNKGNKNAKLKKLEFDHFNNEYPTLQIKKNNGISHDRYIVLDFNTDTETVYHCGASSKDAGRKVCGINTLSNTELIHSLILRLLKNDDYVF